MIINKLSNKVIKETRIIGLYEAFHNHGPNCMCHAKVGNGYKQNSIINSNNCNNSNNINNNQNTSYQTYTTSKPLSISQKIEKDRSKVIDSNYFNDNGSSKYNNSDNDYAFEMATSNIRFGSGCTYEVGYDLLDLGCKNVAIFTDVNLINLKESPVQKVIDSINKISKGSIKYTVFSKVSIEPTSESFKEAISFMDQWKSNIGAKEFDSIVAVGGGSVIDTAKAANLYSTYPPENFLDYVNPPIGKGLPVPGPLKPLIAIPTTAGTGSETTGVAVFDLKMEGVSSKTGIAHRRLKPTLGLVDPDNLKTIPTNVAISSGFDQLCHALESFTAIPFNSRIRASTPLLRPSYQGSNPISDVFSLNSLEMFIKNLPIFINDPTNQRARNNVMLAASLAGVGFGNAGVTIPHGMSYSISSMVKDYKPEGYYNLTKKNLIPHGMSVIMSAPAAFRFTAPFNPERHLILAKIMGANINIDNAEAKAGELLSNEITKLMKKFHVPNGLRALGYVESDIEKLVEGSLPQHRVLKLAAKQPLHDDLTELFKQSMTLY